LELRVKRLLVGLGLVAFGVALGIGLFILWNSTQSFRPIELEGEGSTATRSLELPQGIRSVYFDTYQAEHASVELVDEVFSGLKRGHFEGSEIMTVPESGTYRLQVRYTLDTQSKPDWKIRTT
jgi:hypothetical protein